MYSKKHRRHPKPIRSERIEARLVVYSRDNFTCQDCDKQFEKPKDFKGENIEGLTLGHIIPRCMGGFFRPDNLRAQCEPCNEALGNKIWAKELRRALSNYILK